MRIAVSGANGFVGRQVLSAIAAHGHRPLPLVRRPCGLAQERAIGELGKAPPPPGLLDGTEAVIHLAARTHVMGELTGEELAEYRRVNVAGTGFLLDAAIAAGVRRFVFMSSIKAVAERSRPGEPLGPDAVPRPEDAYGISKLEAERLVRGRCEEAGVEWVILRPPLVYGPAAKGNLDRLARLVAAGLPLPFASIRNARSLVSVETLAEAAVLACSAPGARGKVLHISDITLSTAELARVVAATRGMSARLVPFPPALMKGALRLVGARGLADRLFDSLEMAGGESFDALGWSAPSGRAALERTLAA